MKKLITLIVVLTSVLFISSAFRYKKNEDPEKAEKKARIAMVRKVDGKMIKIDTLITGDSLEDIEESLKLVEKDFNKHTKGEIDSLLKSVMVDVDVELDEDGGKHKIVKLITSGKHFDDIVFPGCVDSTLEKIWITTKIEDGEEGSEIIVWKGRAGDKGEKDKTEIITQKHPHIKVLKRDDGRTIRLDDPSIISFKKKDLSGNREKIEIIREKPENK